MNDITFDGFRNWFAEDPTNRSVRIKFEYGRVNVWVYDFSLMVGQFAESAKDINLMEHYRAQALASYKRAQALLGSLDEKGTVPL